MDCFRHLWLISNYLEPFLGTLGGVIGCSYIKTMFSPFPCVLEDAPGGIWVGAWGAGPCYRDVVLLWLLLLLLVVLLLPLSLSFSLC